MMKINIHKRLLLHNPLDNISDWNRGPRKASLKSSITSNHEANNMIEINSTIKNKILSVLNQKVIFLFCLMFDLVTKDKAISLLKQGSISKRKRTPAIKFDLSLGSFKVKSTEETLTSPQKRRHGSPKNPFKFPAESSNKNSSKEEDKQGEDEKMHF